MRTRTLLAKIPNAVSQRRKTKLPKFRGTLRTAHQLTNVIAAMWQNQVWPLPSVWFDETLIWCGTTEGDPNALQYSSEWHQVRAKPLQPVMGMWVFLSLFGFAGTLVSILQAPGRKGNCLSSTREHSSSWENLWNSTPWAKTMAFCQYAPGRNLTFP